MLSLLDTDRNSTEQGSQSAQLRSCHAKVLVSNQIKIM